MIKKFYAIFFSIIVFALITTPAFGEEDKKQIMPNIKETSLCRSLPEGYKILPSSIKLSPDLKMAGYVAFARNTQNIVVVNDTISPVFYAIYPGTPVLSPKKNRYAYIAYKNKDQVIVVVDGNASRTYEVADNFIFSPDGSRYAYRAQQNDKQYVVIDGNSSPAYNGILIKDNFLFSPDSKRFFYTAYKDDTCVAVIDGKENSNAYNLIEKVKFTPDSSHYVYKARVEKKITKEKWCVVKDNVAGEIYDKIFDIVFSYDSKHMAYAAVKDQQMVMVLDGKEIAEADVMGYPVFSIDSEHFAYALAKDNQWFVIVNDKESPAFDQVYKFQFSPDSRHYSYIAKEDKNWFCVVDGNKGPEFENAIDAFKFSLDSQRYVYAGIHQNKARIITEKGPSENAYASVGEAYFSPDSRHLVYRARSTFKARWATVFDGEKRYKTYNAIGRYEFSPDSRHFAVPVMENLSQSLMLVDGNEQCADQQFKILGNPQFSPNGDYIVYHAMAEENQWYLIINGKVLPDTYGGFMKGTPIIFDGDNRFHTLAFREPGPEFVLIEVEIPSDFPKLTSKL